METDKSEIEENNEFMKLERMMFETPTNTEDELYVKYRLMSFKTLKKIGLQILQNTYSPEKCFYCKTQTSPEFSFGFVMNAK